jgi:hypothetical protein
MRLDHIRRVTRLMERLSGPHAHAVVAVNTGGKGRVTAVSSVSTPRQGGDMEDEEDDRAELDEEDLDGVEGEALPERTQMSVLRMPGHTLPVMPPELE